MIFKKKNEEEELINNIHSISLSLNYIFFFLVHIYYKHLLINTKKIYIYFLETTIVIF